MAAIKNVSLVGATGHLGPYILSALASFGKFKIKVIARSSSKSEITEPKDITISTADFTSITSLTQALSGQDALICCLPSSPSAILSQKLLISACINAGVSCFIPSDFGSDTDNALSRKLPLFREKIEVQGFLEETVKENKTFGYSLIRTNAFLDSGLSSGFILNLKAEEGKVEIFGSGGQLFSATSRETIGQAVVAILHKFEDCKNRAVYIQDVAVSQLQLLGLARKIYPERVWNEQNVDLEIMEAAVNEGKGQLRDSLKLTVWGTGYGGNFGSKLDNELLGIKGKTQEDLEAMIKESYTFMV